MMPALGVLSRLAQTAYLSGKTSRKNNRGVTCRTPTGHRRTAGVDSTVLATIPFCSPYLARLHYWAQSARAGCTFLSLLLHLEPPLKALKASSHLHLHSPASPHHIYQNVVLPRRFPILPELQSCIPQCIPPVWCPGSSVPERRCRRHGRTTEHIPAFMEQSRWHQDGSFLVCWTFLMKLTLFVSIADSGLICL